MLQHADQLLHSGALRRPARSDAHDGHVLLLLPKAHRNVRREVGELRLVEREEDLIRRAVDGERVALLRECRADAVRCRNRVRAPSP